MNETATVGRIVHYVCPETKADRAAIVTEVRTKGAIDLTVFRPRSSPHFHEGGEYYPCGVGYCPDKTPGTWHWPERN